MLIWSKRMERRMTDRCFAEECAQAGREDKKTLVLWT